MTIIARNGTEPGTFDLFEQVQVIDDMTGETIGNKNESIGTISLDVLTEQKTLRQTEIDLIQEKIDAINLLQ